MTLTDEELDRDWKPNGRRPVSTIARSFSAELMDIFKIEGSVAELDAEVDRKKQKVQQEANELESLEARIREMEERLRRSQQSHARRPIPAELQTQAPRQQDDTQARLGSSQDNVDDTMRSPRVTSTMNVEKSRSRPGSSRTARAAPSSGAMPPTPVASEGEYHMVEKADLNDDEADRDPRRI